MNRILFFIVILLSTSLFSQAQPWMDRTHSGAKNFFDISRAFYEGHKSDESDIKKEDAEEENDGDYEKFKRWEWFWKPRVGKTGAFPKPDHLLNEWNNYLKNNPSARVRTGADLHAARMLTTGTSTPVWSFSGPSSSTSNYQGVGRVNCIAFHPTDSNTFWVGAASGGLWKTDDGGDTWSTNTDNLPVLGVTDIAICSTNPSTIYIATGDGDHGDNNSLGVLKTTDGGATWTTTGLTWTAGQGRLISRLLMDPTNPAVLIAAASDGIWRTEDSGATWVQVELGHFIDLTFHPTNHNILYATTYNTYGGSYICRSADNGVTWLCTQILGSLRVKLAVSPAAPNRVDALAANDSSGLLGLWRSVDTGATFSEYFTGSATSNFLNGSIDGSGSGGQGWYDLAYAVSPTNPSQMFIGGVNGWKSSDTGNSWSIMSYWVDNTLGIPVVHADKHWLAFHPLEANTLFECNDGGVYKTRDNGVTWMNITNGLGNSQIYKISPSPLVANNVICGLQDNGTKELRHSNWFNQTGGDGTDCIIDYTDSNIEYASYVNGVIYRTTDDWATSSTIVNSGETGVNGNGNWVTPFIMHPSNHNILLVGKDQVYQTLDAGTTWAQLGTILSPTGNIVVMAYAPSATSTIYVCYANELYATVDSGATWTLKATFSNFITGVAVDPTNGAHLWITNSGYTAGHKVFESVDGGSTWSNISDLLPNVPVNCIAVQHDSHPGIYIGTDLGVFYNKLGCAGWQSFNVGLPNVVVADLKISAGFNKIWAGTYGRGLWSSSLETSVGIAPISGAETVCEGSTITLSDSSSGNWSSSNPAIATVDPGTGVLTGVSTGTVTISYGCDTFVIKTITVNASPSPISGGGQICIASTVTLTDSVSGGVWSSSDTSVALTTAYGGVKGLSIGAATVTYTKSGCSRTHNILVTDTPSVISGPSNICRTSLCNRIPVESWENGVPDVWTQLNGSASPWFQVNGDSTFGSFTGGTPPGGGAFVAEFNSYNMPAGTSSILVSPNIDLSAVTGATVSLWVYRDTTTAYGADTMTTEGVYLYQNSVANDSAAVFIGFVPRNNAAPISYGVSGISTPSVGGWYQYTFNLSGSAASNYILMQGYSEYGANVYVDLVSISGTGASTVQFANSAVGGSWKSSDTNMVQINAASGFAKVKGVGAYTITYSNACGSSTKSITVLSNPAPISSLIKLCAGATSSLSDSTAGGSWTVSDTSLATISSSGVLAGVSSGYSTFFYTVGSCYSDITVQIKPVPAPIAGPRSSCEQVLQKLLPDESFEASVPGTWNLITDSSSTPWFQVSGASTANPSTSGTPTGGGTFVAEFNSYWVPVGGYSALASPTFSLSGITGASVSFWVYRDTTSFCLNDSLEGITVLQNDAASLSGATVLGFVPRSAAVPISGLTGVSMPTVAGWYQYYCSLSGSSATNSVLLNAYSQYGNNIYLDLVSVQGTGHANLQFTESVPGCSWSSSDTSVAVIDHTTGILTSIRTGTVNVISTNSCGSASKTVYLMGKPSMISGSTTICSTIPATYTDSMPGGTWSVSDSILATVDSVSGILTAAVGGVVTLTYTSACGNYATLEITIVPYPHIDSLSGSSAACVGEHTTLYGFPGGGYWTSVNTNATVTVGGVVTGVDLGEDSIKYTLTNICGTDIAAKAITVGTVPAVAALSGMDTICVGAFDTIAASISGGVWSVSDSVLTIAAAGIMHANDTGSDSVLYTLTNVCGSTPTSFVVNVMAAPVHAPIVGADSVCLGAQITLSDSTSAGIWSAVGSNVTVGITGIVTGSFAGYDTVLYTTGNRCGTNAARHTVFVNHIPLPAPIISADTLCIGAIGSITDSTPGGIWTTTNGNAAIAGSAITGNVSGWDTVYYKVWNICGADSVSRSIYINPLPAAGTISGTDTVCIGTSYTLTAANPGGIWTLTNTNATETGGIVTGANTGKDTVLYIVSNFCGRDTVVHPLQVMTLYTKNAIAGLNYACVYRGADTLTGTPAGGIWHVTNGNAAVTTAGIVHAINTGADTIVYVLSNFCGVTRDSFTVTIPSLWECDSISAIERVENGADKINVYPNPATGAFTVEFTGNCSHLEAILYDVCGKELLHSGNNTDRAQILTMQLQEIAAGTYFVKVTVDGVAYMKKLNVAAK
jgi:uncharacterized protein YjdB